MAAAKVQVRLTIGAEADLRGIWQRRKVQRGAEGADGADALLVQLLARIESLADFPHRGPRPPELEALGITDWRQVSHRHFRIVYRVDEGGETSMVTVVVIADSRRDFRTLLEERLLRRG